MLLTCWGIFLGSQGHIPSYEQVFNIDGLLMASRLCGLDLSNRVSFAMICKVFRGTFVEKDVT